MAYNNQEWSRRKFIIGMTTAGTAIMLPSFPSWANNEIDPRVVKIINKSIGIDSHNHIDVPFKEEAFLNQKYDLATEIKKSGFSAICMTFAVDRPQLTKTDEAHERFLISLDEMDEILKANNMKRALDFSDLKKARKQNIPIVVQSVEGGHFLEGKIERLEIAHKRGLRHLGLLHDNQPSVPIGDIYTNAAQFGGLTEFGKTVVKESNKLGILLDLAHCSNDAINDAIKTSSKPVLISHTGLNTQLGSNERMAKMMMPRLISKEQAKIVAEAGGVIGVWTHLADSPLEYAQNIRALVDVVGTEHVCIGTDSKMTTPANTNDRFGKNTNQSWGNEKEGFFYNVVGAMLKTGFTEDEIIKIGGGNYCRIFETATLL